MENAADQLLIAEAYRSNPVRDSVISIVNNLPKEFELDAYVDYEKQFVKAFLDPIKVMLDCVGWKTEKVNTLERFFG